MTFRTLAAGALVGLVTGIVGCGTADDSISDEAPEGAMSERFSTTPGEPNHEEITATALSFLRADVLAALQAANVLTDIEFFLVSANHFDDCNFSGGSQVVAQSQAEAVAQLAPKPVAAETDLLAIRAFARSLHALQDFYAHTNWVELGGEALVDSSLKPFPLLSPYSTIRSSGFVVVQGSVPKRASVSRDVNAAYPESAAVRVKQGPKQGQGLISGTVDYEPGNFCPGSVAMSHEELNKDKSSNLDRSEQYEAAKTLAILQTEHEWCRLRELTRAKWGNGGVARLDRWVASGAVPPTCN